METSNHYIYSITATSKNNIKPLIQVNQSNKNKNKTNEKITDGRRTYRLISLRAALVTRIRGYDHHRLDFSSSCYNALDLHQLTYVSGFHVAYGYKLLFRRRLEVNLTVKEIKQKNSLKRNKLIKITNHYKPNKGTTDVFL
jgi:hypothetical protein